MGDRSRILVPQKSVELRANSVRTKKHRTPRCGVRSSVERFGGSEIRVWTMSTLWLPDWGVRWPDSYGHLNHWAKSRMAKGKAPKAIHNVHGLISAAVNTADA